MFHDIQYIIYLTTVSGAFQLQNKISECHVFLDKTLTESEINLIGAIISIDEKWAPPWWQGFAVYAITMVLRCNESLARHHIQHRLVLASEEP